LRHRRYADFDLRALWSVIVSCTCAVFWHGQALGAEDIRLKPHIGQCDYTFNPVKDVHNTSCSAEALLFNAQTSELFFCVGKVEGDQYVAPSVNETAPDSITCTRMGQPYTSRGSYDVALADDTAKADKTLNKLRGTYTWKNAFWLSSRETLDVKLCARLVAAPSPDHRIVCSKKVDWIK
jgi:hypothetical protein